MSYRIKRLCYLGLLTAMQVVLSRFLSINIPPTAEYLIKIGFSFLPIGVAAILFGPLWGGACAALGDVI
ncbi:MAG: ECF transporter S component, partial [Oscillospiraceae bacterium]|nr:ECF transporter S component [Oscillospiraceae bacterium]